MQSGEVLLPARYAGRPGSAPKSFSYASLPPDDAAKLRETAEAIRSHGRRIGRNIIAVGELLLAVKSGLPHGDFGPWLEAEFRWSERAAQNYMRAATVFGAKSEIVADLPPTTLYDLASPSTPEPVRAVIIERLERREPLAVDAIREMVRDARYEAKRERDIAKLPPRRQKLIRKDAEERAAAAEKWAAERHAREAATSAAARLIVTRVGDDLPELLRLLKASDRAVYLTDIETAAGRWKHG